MSKPKNWIENAARAIMLRYDLRDIAPQDCSVYAISELIWKHCPFQPDTAYMRVPRWVKFEDVPQDGSLVVAKYDIDTVGCNYVGVIYWDKDVSCWMTLCPRAVVRPTAWLPMALTGIDGGN